MDDLYWSTGCLRAGSLGNPSARRHEGRKMKEKLIRVAVYGTLMTGQRNEHWGANARRRVSCTIRGVLYDTGWGFPAFVPVGKGIVKAEFVVLPESDWPAIDRLESYPTLYDRRKIGARLPSGNVEIGWVYIMNNLPAGARVIPGGDWRNR
jgi:gamma-glutamylcyclotransferase (GGCT)/AIG2-like uncharacterized protein YtfP